MKFSFATKSYGKETILLPITLTLTKGEIIVLMGPSGSGKTTLLKLIAGLEKDDHQNAKSTLKIGMMFQEPRLLPWKTVQENIEVAGPIDHLLKDLDLEDAGALYPRQISLGMARRVAFARALASTPDLLLLDEPFASLDEDRVTLMQNLILSAKDKLDIPIVMTTHDRRKAEALQAKIYQLEGRPASLISVE
ncbi:MAG: ATP-binding cassette domain-containing protein [Hyphomicrobiales bacterium]